MMQCPFCGEKYDTRLAASRPRKRADRNGYYFSCMNCRCHLFFPRRMALYGFLAIQRGMVDQFSSGETRIGAMHEYGEAIFKELVKDGRLPAEPHVPPTPKT